MDSRLLPTPAPDDAAPPFPAAALEETLVADVRAGMTPAQMVESRLAFLLQTKPPSVGRMQNDARLRAQP